LEIEHAKSVSILIRSQIDEIDKIANEAVADEGAATIDNEDEVMLSTPPSVVQGPELRRGKVFVDGHVELRSYQPPATVLSFENHFTQRRLAAWLTNELPAIGVPLPNGIMFGPEDYVSATLVSLQSAFLDAV
jgi:hypothetical protein